MSQRHVTASEFVEHAQCAQAGIDGVTAFHPNQGSHFPALFVLEGVAYALGGGHEL